PGGNHLRSGLGHVSNARHRKQEKGRRNPALFSWAARGQANHPDFDKVSFTCSTASRRGVMPSVVPTLDRLTLEQGGSYAATIIPGFDISETAEQPC
ncbi:aldehyde dehydrogenase family protein, partial [Croceicoccus sp. BE223]|uniref:aldehyde dehydrogenase family protein n=1 Tax=Croceicoccus sp. BE223 TaxID=2817716 RepID=UPI00286A098D